MIVKRNISAPSGARIPVVQPVASHYSGSTVLAYPRIGSQIILKSIITVFPYLLLWFSVHGVFAYFCLIFEQMVQKVNKKVVQ
jgi:hypothetical protein